MAAHGEEPDPRAHRAPREPYDPERYVLSEEALEELRARLAGAEFTQHTLRGFRSLRPLRKQDHGATLYAHSGGAMVVARSRPEGPTELLRVPGEVAWAIHRLVDGPRRALGAPPSLRGHERWAALLEPAAQRLSWVLSTCALEAVCIETIAETRFSWPLDAVLPPRRLPLYCTLPYPTRWPVTEHTRWRRYALRRDALTTSPEEALRFALSPPMASVELGASLLGVLRVDASPAKSDGTFSFAAQRRSARSGVSLALALGRLAAGDAEAASVLRAAWWQELELHPSLRWTLLTRHPRLWWWLRRPREGEWLPTPQPEQLYEAPEGASAEDPFARLLHAAFER